MTLGDDETMTPGSGAREGADDVMVIVRLRAAAAYRRALRLLTEAVALVEEQQELEEAVTAVAGTDDGWMRGALREATGLAALDSVLGNAATEIAAPGGGLWCGGPPRPWPEEVWSPERPATN